MRLAPSILAGDLADLAGVARQCAEGGADLLHVDVMDGHFVPNLTFGAPVMAALVKRTELPLDVHLMVESPGDLLDLYLEGGAARISVHWEATTHLDRVLARIRAAGAAAGVALNPATPIDCLAETLPLVDFVLLMSVNPGFAGQPFLPYVVDKARRLHAWIRERSLSVTVDMDGGIGADNIERVAAAGVDVCVAGSAVFGAPDPVQAMRDLKRSGERGSR